MDNDTEAALDSWKQSVGMIEKLFAVTKPGVVFGEPVTAGEHTVITASEVMVGLGFGYGAGSGAGAEEASEASEVSEPADVGKDQEAEEFSGFGIGGGGGGGSFGRPVAAISVGPGGVRVDPVFDATKVGLAFFTALGAMFLMLGKMKRAARR